MGIYFFPVTLAPQCTRTFCLIILVQARWVWGEFSDLCNKKGKWNLYKTSGNIWLNTKLLLNMKCIRKEHICERWACERFHPSDGSMFPSWKTYRRNLRCVGYLFDNVSCDSVWNKLRNHVIENLWIRCYKFEVTSSSKVFKRQRNNLTVKKLWKSHSFNS